MSTEKKGFVIYKDWCLTILALMKDDQDPLTHVELGQFMEAIFTYQATGEDISQSLPKHIRFLFKNIVDVFNRDLEKWEATREKRRESGKMGGLAKAGKPSKCQDFVEKNPPVEPVPKVPKAPKPPKAPCLFEDFYALYPRKEAKQNALKAYQKAVKQVSHETIIEGVSKYKQQIEAKQIEKQYIKQPATWLNGGCWDDEYTSTTTSTIQNTNAYEDLLEKIKSVMDKDGSFMHGVEQLNFYSIKDSIGINGEGYKVYYDSNGIMGHKVIYLDAIGEKTHVHS